ncbi:hypothetical protein GGTG_11349 [Gaeumannomyces tritici R3-111a-1]|uniref:Uncharacterized protein n=1 Tax=Gaeumannomyces tritici (strain R3-111a-1) TaxID=644352 RepID=J3PCY0_GAET3|nr:hypothetical protein GGTG_11349 [Gaeumannomyces tritici R3-111a-1]EJT72102.1 hypothetical protein GGTG_11349 [Gaeumannomyces tritici R3-111a-1]
MTGIDPGDCNVLGRSRLGVFRHSIRVELAVKANSSGPIVVMDSLALSLWHPKLKIESGEGDHLLTHPGGRRRASYRGELNRVDDDAAGGGTLTPLTAESLVRPANIGHFKCLRERLPPSPLIV